MKKKKSNRSFILTLRLTPEEQQKLQVQWKKTTCRKRGDFVRRVLFEKAIVTQTRDKSLDDFMAEMILLRKELIRIGNNYNQVVVKLHTMKNFSEIRGWLAMHDVTEKILLQKMETIKTIIQIKGEKWLQ